jgi:hypothetical protein
MVGTRLGEEELDKIVTSLYLHKTTRKRILACTSTYASGRVVKEFADKRKKDEVTYGEN